MNSGFAFLQQKRVAFAPALILTLTLLIGLLFSILQLFAGHLPSQQGALSAKGKAMPNLLLSSGLSSAEQATVTIIFWLPQRPASDWVDHLPRGWKWTESSSAAGGSGPVTVAGSNMIGQKEERGMLTLYQVLAGSAAKIGGQAYLDERIQEPLDIFRYFSTLRLEPRQWAYSGSTFSLAGYLAGKISPVQAGPDPVNLQLLTRSHSGRGETVLAIPALLEEF